jgi:Fe2+ transport system protein FeoA
MKMDFNETAASAARDAAGLPFTLDLARPGARLIVDHVDVESAPAGRRLVDLGLLPNTPVRVVRRAPLGDPTEYALRGYRLCLRRVDAARIWVREAAAPTPDEA